MAKIILEIPDELVTELETSKVSIPGLPMEVEAIKLEEQLRHYLQSLLVKQREEAQLTTRREIIAKARTDLEAVKVTKEQQKPKEGTSKG